MITQPTTARLIEVVRKELSEHVTPAVTDPQLQTSLQMIDHILSTLAVRAQHEIAWMVEETKMLRRLGRDIVAAHPEASAVATALAEAEAQNQESLHYDDVARRYGLASEILSSAYEHTPNDSPLRPQIEEAFDHRLGHELEIIGQFQLVGRT
ncbi:MAG TPA: hypothetical protein VFZ97_10450 [Acidimicrobiales bacterium]